MSGDTYKYTTLICSLPAFGPLFKAQQTPLSRINLEQRLTMLEPNDYEVIEKLSQLLDWFQHPLERSDAELLSMVKKILPTIENEFIRAQVEWRLSLRTLVAASRRKQLGLALPQAQEWGFGPWTAFIARHWQEPIFGLERLVPWLAKVNDLLANAEAAALEKYLLQLVWEELERVAMGHEFDLEAVALYRLRWDLVARWTAYGTDLAKVRFETLADHAMRVQADLK